jgi:hypothetical protein
MPSTFSLRSTQNIQQCLQENSPLLISALTTSSTQTLHPTFDPETQLQCSLNEIAQQPTNLGHGAGVAFGKAVGAPKDTQQKLQSFCGNFIKQNQAASLVNSLLQVLGGVHGGVIASEQRDFHRNYQAGKICKEFAGKLDQQITEVEKAASFKP